MADRFSQPCWDCKKYNKQCSWSKKFQPIDGWVAKETIIKNEGRCLKSYKILNCPEFIADEIKYKVCTNIEIAKYLGINRRTLYRWMKIGKISNENLRAISKKIEEEREL